MSELRPFIFPVTGAAVRVVTIDGEPWFVAVDAGTILGYANTRKAINDHVPARHQKGNESFPLSDLGLHPQTKLISEGGLYRLVMRSDAPLAEPFQDWVTDDVLPTVRRTGSYSVAQRELPEDYSAALRALADEHDAHRLTRQERDEAQARNAELEPAADAWNALAEAKGDYSLREAAQILSRDPLISTGQNRLAAYLREIGWVDSTKQPYQREIDNGRLGRRSRDYFDQSAGEQKTSTQIRITVKGLKELRGRMAGQRQLIVIEGGA